MNSSTIDTYSRQMRSLIALGLPIIVGQLGNIVTGLADTIMVGQHGTDELAAASFVNNVINSFIILGTGFSFNLTPLIGSNLAIEKRTRIGGWVKNSIIANLTTTLLILFLLTLLYFNLSWLRQPEELMPLIKPYYLVTMCSIVFVMLSNSFRQFFEGITDASVSMWVLTVGNIVNIIGNYILIYGKCGMPEMGLLGAGLSTLFSRFLMCLSFFCIFLFSRCYRTYKKGFLVTRIKYAYWKRLNGLGWPIACQQGIESATFSITTIMIGWIGSVELAAHQVAIAISTVSFTIYLGLGTAVAIKTSIYKGHNDWEGVKTATLSGVYIGMCLSVLACCVLYCFCDTIGSLFTDDKMVSGMVAMLMPVLMAYQFGDSIQIIIANALRGLADVRSLMVIAVISFIVVALPAGYCFAFLMDKGIVGVWFTYPVGFLCAVTLLSYRFRRIITLRR